MSGKETLRPYQTAMLDAIAAHHANGSNRLLVKSGTGTGKTTSFASLLTHQPIQDWLAQFGETDRRMLVIAHREELLDQSAARIQKQNPGLMVMVEQGDRHASVYADVIVASIQTLSAMKFRRLSRLLARLTFRLVVVDEAHHSAAATYRTALAMLGFLPLADISTTENIEAATHDDVDKMTQALAGWDLVAPKDRLLVGVTATPNRSDSIGLGCVFQSIAYSYDLKTAIADGWLVPIVPWAIDTDTSLDGVKIQRGDFNQRELADAVNNPQRNALALAAWKEHAGGASTIGFTVDVQHAHDMADLFDRAGISARAVSGETPKDDRRGILRQFSDGQIQVVFNCMVLTEGTDLPRAGCILHAKPTKSATLYEQMTGRGLRLFPGKTQCTVIDLVDVARRHSLQTAPVLYGLPPTLTVKGKKLSEVADGFEAMLSEHPGLDVEAELANGRLTLEQLGARASLVNVWAVPTLGDFGEGRIVQWLKIGDDKYRVTYPWADGSETVEVSKDLIGQWEVVATVKPKDDGPRRQRTLATQIPSAINGAAIAEAFIERERRSVLRLAGTDAPWKQRPASPKQIGLMRKLGIAPIPKGCSMGAASQLIDLAMARRTR